MILRTKTDGNTLKYDGIPPKCYKSLSQQFQTYKTEISYFSEKYYD